MAFSEVSITVAGGGIGRRAPNQDKISGYVVWNAATPSGFASVIYQKVFTLAQAEGLGIVTGSTFDSEHYQISEFFRANDEGELWIAWNGAAADPTFQEIVDLQQAASGTIRQMMMVSTAVFDGLEPTAITAKLALIPSDQPLSVVFAAEFSTLTAATLPDLRALTSPKVSVVVAQAGDGAAKAITDVTNISLANVGAALGTLSRAGVQESIGHPARFNSLSNGSDMEVLMYGTGENVADLTITQQEAVKTLGYLVARKRQPQLAGSFWERVPTSVVFTDDFAFIENNRVIDKAIRLVSAALTPQLQSGLLLNTDGTLSDSTVGFFKDLCEDPLTGMQSDIEISDSEVLIDPLQDVLATSTLEVTIRILPIGIAEFISVTIGLTAEI
jgi:hypothetical protein